MKNIYRIEIPSKLSDATFFFWIGANLELVSTMDQAVPCSFEDHLLVMEKIDCEAVAYREAA